MMLSRRKFLIGTGLVGSGLIIGCSFRGDSPLPRVDGSFQPNAWLQITPDGEVIFQLDKAEMGQGVYSSLATIVGEELDYDPANIMVQMAPPNAAYNNPAMGMQVTGGSTSVATGWTPLREAGASARAMLLGAAAQEWAVSANELSTNNGWVIHEASGRRASYGQLAEAAKQQALPKKVSLKESADFKWIGKQLKGFDSAAKIDGTATFGVDVQLEGMKVAVVVRCPHFGGSLKSFDGTEAAAMPGVHKVFAIHNGVAVVADGYWYARQAAAKLKVEWDKGPLAGLDSESILKSQWQAMETDDPLEVTNEGDVAGTFANTDLKLVEAEYSAPFLHHSTMEPQNCAGINRGDEVEIWAPNQAPQFVQALAAEFGGFDPATIRVHSTFLGGGFGRRAMPDYAGELGAILREMPNVPVKLIWSREDDMRHDFYRPSTVHRFKGAVDGNGNVQAWQHRLVSASIIKGMAVTMVGTYMPGWLPESLARGIGRVASKVIGGMDKTTAEGAAEVPYAIANKRVDVAIYDPGIPLGFWRSVGHSHNAFVVESFIDELAHAAGADPVQFRQRYLEGHPRHLQVLTKAAEAANWGSPAAGRYQGVAVHESFASFVAEVVEVSLLPGSALGYKIERVVCAVDCGQVVNPTNVVAQIEGGVVYALSAALKAPLSIKDGAVVQSNFHDLPVLRFDEMPEVEVLVLDSSEAPTGAGEIGVPPLAPALANAIFAASGQRLRAFPLAMNTNASTGQA